MRKNLVARSWWSNGDTYRTNYATLIRETDLVDDDLLRAVPGPRAARPAAP